jgi:nitrogen fixation/metabolism regulation signal transduction histidine kinase
VFVAVLALGLNLIVVRTLERRVVNPLRELTRVLDSARQGDTYRRCRATDAPADLRRALSVVNELLDERVSVIAAGSRRTERDSSLPIERAALHHLLEKLSAPTVVLGARGQVMAANLVAMDVLGGTRGEAVHEALVGLSKGTSSPLVSSTPFDASGGLLCTLLVDPEPPRSGPPGSVPPVHAG